MKAVLHFPTEQYGYSEVEIEVEAPEEAIEAYNLALNASRTGDGVGIKQLAQIIHEYCLTGAIKGGADYQDRYSKNESLLIGEIKKLVRNNQK